MLRKFPKLSRFIIYYVSSILLIYLIEHVLFSQQIFQVFNLNEHLISDIQFNDLYYTKHGDTGADTYMDKEKKVILVNMQELPYSEKGREMYLSMISRLEGYKVGAIGVDVTFSKKQKDVFGPVKNNPKIIFASQTTQNDIFFPNHGDISFPKIGHHEQRSIRYYKNDPKSFGAQLIQVAYPKTKTNVGDDASFLIHYNSIQSGLCHLNDIENPHYNKDYKFLNAGEILSDSLNIYESEFKDKIVIIGYLGDRKHADAMYDIEDKKRVPVDLEHFVNRDPIMFGAVIHANAISTILNKEEQFTVIGDGIILAINLFICALFMYVLLFKNLGKLWNRVILFALTIPMLFLILFFMDHGIYYKFGGTLLALLVIEEMFEILEPYDHKYLHKHLKHD
jgi:CHASE2 domain-containing sensor protein